MFEGPSQLTLKPYQYAADVLLTVRECARTIVERPGGMAALSSA
jgi:hypothetical protein